ncbi:MAG: hypothetical protein ABWZ25_05345 [Chitinophagaceae bacterium]
MNRKIIYLLALCLLPLVFHAQKTLTGVWTGKISNDSNTVRRDQSFEIALTQYREKVYGYSRTTFIVRDTLYYVLKRVTGKVDGETCEIKDDEVISYNFPGRIDKGVKVTTTFHMNKQDSTWHLDGKWSTNKTKKYYAITGAVVLKEETDPTASRIFAHLEELTLNKGLDLGNATNKNPNVEAALAVNTPDNNIAITPASSKAPDNSTTKDQTSITSGNKEKSPVADSTNNPTGNTTKNSPANTTINPSGNSAKNSLADTAINSKANTAKHSANTTIDPSGNTTKNSIADTTINSKANTTKNSANTTVDPSGNTTKNPPVNSTINPPLTATTNTPGSSSENKTGSSSQQKETSVASSNTQKEPTTSVKAEDIKNKAPEKNTIPVVAISPKVPAAEINARVNTMATEIFFQGDSLELTLYDNGEVDGDTVSVLLNGEIILSRQVLKASALRTTIATPAGQEKLLLVLYAENLGKYPPNTGLLVVKDGETTHQIRFSADLTKNAAIILRRTIPVK